MIINLYEYHDYSLLDIKNQIITRLELVKINRLLVTALQIR